MGIVDGGSNMGWSNNRILLYMNCPDTCCYIQLCYLTDENFRTVSFQGQ